MSTAVRFLKFVVIIVIWDKLVFILLNIATTAFTALQKLLNSNRPKKYLQPYKETYLHIRKCKIFIQSATSTRNTEQKSLILRKGTICEFKHDAVGTLTIVSTPVIVKVTLI